MRWISSSTWLRLARGGSMPSTRWLYSSAPTRLPWRVSSRASTVTKPSETDSLVRSLEPKSTEPDRSSRNQAVSSRSSVNCRTCGLEQPRGDVPVDVAHVVAVLVHAQVGQVEPGAAPQRAVVALQQAVEPADHRPLQLPQQLVGRGDGRGQFSHGCRSAQDAAAACRAPAPWPSRARRWRRRPAPRPAPRTTAPGDGARCRPRDR